MNEDLRTTENNSGWCNRPKR